LASNAGTVTLEMSALTKSRRVRAFRLKSAVMIAPLLVAYCRAHDARIQSFIGLD
jgi:hypothetical protein